MVVGGRRLLSLIRSVFATLAQILSTLTKIAEALSRVERATAPSGPLGVNEDAWLGLRPASAAAYAKSVQDFAEWIQTRQLQAVYPAEIDRAVVRYAQEKKLTRAKLENLCAALRRGLPQLKGNLSWAEMHLKNLLRYSPPVHKVPMLRFVALVVGYTMALDGFARAGALLILQVCSGMRPGELLGLKREDLVAGRRGVNNGNAVIALGRKTGTKAGRAQFIVIHAAEDPFAISIISAFCATTKFGQALSSLDYIGYSKILSKTLAKMRLADMGFTPHSPRAGWATTLRLQGMAFSEIQERGRWAQAATLRTYLDAVAASTVLLHRTHDLYALGNWLDESFTERFPWWTQ